MPDPRAIGVFDSGVGGLTVVRALIDDLPHESILYFGDTGRYPYGPRALEEISGFAVQIATHLVEQDVKLIVVACNAATAAGLNAVVEASPVPVIGVIAPAVRAAIRATRNGSVGLIGTVATVTSGAYQRAFRDLAGTANGHGVQVTARACPLFVELVERGDTTSPTLLEAAGEYLEPLKEAAIDTLILGCTHYPLLRGAIHHVMGPDVLLLSSAEETAADVYEELSRRALLADTAAIPSYRFESSGDPGRFAELGRRFLGPEVGSAAHVSLEPVPGG
jgi:glutamate racemase